MKQKRFGQKVQNWHRPLGRDQLNQRYLRQRYDDRESESEIEQHLSGLFEVDEYWDWKHSQCCLVCGDSNCLSMYWPEGSEADVAFHQLAQFARGLLSPSLQTVMEGTFVQQDTVAADSCVREMRTSIVDSPIEERLAKHIDDLVGGAMPADLETSLRLSIGNQANIDALIRATEDRSPTLTHAVHLSLFSPFWIRQPATWDPIGGRSLLEHLFVRYPVPPFLSAAWFGAPDDDDWVNLRKSLKWRCWFIIIAQGGSLRRARRFFDWNVSGAFQHNLGTAPDGLSPREACVYAEIARLGGTILDYQRITSNLAFQIDPTEPSDDNAFPVFWRHTVEWMIRHSAVLTEAEGNLILEWAMHGYTEARQCGEVFSWKGRTPQATVERAVQYRQLRDHPWQFHSWASHDCDWIMVDDSKTWSFQELTSTEELLEEGQVQKHCVASYADRCAAGYSAIISLQCDGQRTVTIEIHPRSRQIMQVRGLQNRSATAREDSIIRRWEEQVLRR